MYGVAFIGLWIYAVRKYRSSTVLVGGWRWTWLVIFIVAPVLGPLLFLSALRAVERCSQPQPGRLERLLQRES